MDCKLFNRLSLFGWELFTIAAIIILKIVDRTLNLKFFPGTDEAAIIAILSKRTSSQRRAISDKFRASFGKVSLHACL